MVDELTLHDQLVQFTLDKSQSELKFPSSLTSYHRHEIHKVNTSNFQVMKLEYIVKEQQEQNRLCNILFPDGRTIRS